MKLRNLIGTIGKFIHFKRNAIRILMYHRVNPSSDLADSHISVTPESFYLQMKWLKVKGWRVISMDEAVMQINSGLVPEKQQVVITFDDGFRDNFEHAYPVLNQFNYPATIFLAVNRCFMGNNDYLEDRQIKVMLENKIDFGAHTLSHPFLTESTDQQAWVEINDSRRLLTKYFGFPIKGFAYPAGRFNRKHYDMVVRSGYQYALSIRPGSNSKNEDLFALRRTEIACHDSLMDFENKLSGGFDLLHTAHQFTQGLYPAPQT